MLLLDVHAHMDMEGYEGYGGADRLIEECAANGVSVILCNGVNAESNRKVLDICSRHKVCRPALGIYPVDCMDMIIAGRQEEFDHELEFIEDSLKKKQAVAIGEIGLEYKVVKDISEAQKNIQKGCLKKFLELAVKYDVPVILHSRGAELELIELLEHQGMKDKKVIMHCFSGRKHHVKRIRDNGWFFSIPCNIGRSEHFQKIVIDTSLQQLFTETDSPLLSPYQGKANRPDNVLLTINKIAQIKNMEPEEVANIIYNNYQRVFL